MVFWCAWNTLSVDLFRWTDAHLSQTFLSRKYPQGVGREILAIRCQETVPSGGVVVSWTKDKYMTSAYYREFEEEDRDMLEIFRKYFDHDVPQILQSDSSGYGPPLHYVIDIGRNRSILLFQRSRAHEALLGTRRVTSYIFFGDQAEDAKFAEACRNARSAGNHASIVGYTDLASQSDRRLQYSVSDNITTASGVSRSSSNNSTPMGFQTIQTCPSSLYGTQLLVFSADQQGTGHNSARSSGIMGPSSDLSGYGKQ